MSDTPPKRKALSFKNRPQLGMIINRDHRLSLAARAVLAELLDHRNPENGQCNPSVERIADRIGRKNSTVRAAIKEAGAIGYLSARRSSRSSHYTFHLEAFEAAKAEQDARDEAFRERRDSGGQKGNRPPESRRTEGAENAPDCQDSGARDRRDSGGHDRRDSGDKPLKGNHQRGTKYGVGSGLSVESPSPPPPTPLRGAPPLGGVGGGGGFRLPDEEMPLAKQLAIFERQTLPQLRQKATEDELDAAEEWLVGVAEDQDEDESAGLINWAIRLARAVADIRDDMRGMAFDGADQPSAGCPDGPPDAPLAGDCR